MNPVVHFEMPYQDHERVSKFYSQAFGWQMNKLGENMGDYILATTAETDDNNMVKTPGTINGGFGIKTENFTMPSLVISVEDIQSGMKRATDAGGKVIGQPIPIPGIGQYVSFYDTEGNKASLLQPMTV